MDEAGLLNSRYTHLDTLVSFLAGAPARRYGTELSYPVFADVQRRTTNERGSYLTPVHVTR